MATISQAGVDICIIEGVNWQDYEKDYALRTDAVWEKDQLKDWFRLYTKVLLFCYISVSISIQQLISIH